MATPYCKACFKPVTAGKCCSLCTAPVCHDHRSKLGNSWSDKTSYYCKPPCSGKPAAPQAPNHPGPAPLYYPPPPGGYAGRGSGSGPTGGGSAYPPAQYAGSSSQPQGAEQQRYQGRTLSPPPNTSYYGSQGGASPNGMASSGSSSQSVAQGYPSPVQPAPPASNPYHSSTSTSLFALSPNHEHQMIGTSPASNPRPASSNSLAPPAFAPASGGQPPAPPAAPGMSMHDAVVKFGPGAGDPLPTAPSAENGVVTCSFANGQPCVIPDNPSALAEFVKRNFEGKTVRRGDVLQFSPDATRNEVRRGVFVGELNSSAVVLERRRAEGTGYASAAIVIPPSQCHTVTVLQLGRCRHCGCLIPLDEARLHVDKIHKTSSTASTRVDETHGLCVGNVELLLGLRPIRKLGEGAQGTVSLCEPPSTVFVDEDVKMALYVRKDIRCATQEEAVARYQQAVRLMSLRHPHVVRYLAVQRTPQGDYVRVVMPYYPEYDLQKIIRQTTDKIKEDWICSVVLQLATALKHLHSHSPPILHGDLKPDNVMLHNNRNQVILMDFDTSVELGRERANASTGHIGTFEWTAPEAVAGGSRPSVNSDVWSLGLIAFVLCVLPEYPMLENDKGEALLLNSSEWRPEELRAKVRQQVVARGYRPDLVDLIQDMMALDPARRPTAAVVADRMSLVMESILLARTTW
jgi:hypothetical protein